MPGFVTRVSSNIQLWSDYSNCAMHTPKLVSKSLEQQPATVAGVMALVQTGALCRPQAAVCLHTPTGQPC